jgi:glycosyltransferase involved in cell wall biosynthesis
METKKRVLVFIPEFPVLTETFIERELAKLAERGNVELTVFSLKRGENNLSDVLEDKVYYGRYRLSDIFNGAIFFITNFSKILKVFLDFEKNVKNNKNSRDGCIKPGLLKRIYTFLKSVGYAKKFLHFKPDFILAHFLSEPSTMVMHISQITNIPYGVSAHAKDILVTSEYTRLKVKTAKFITICNKNAYESVLDQADGLDVSNVNLAYHGVDVQKILATSQNKDFRIDKPLILANGRLVEKKGLTYLIEASRILKEKGLDFLVYIIGSGPLYRETLDKINSLGLSGNIKILGDNKGVPIDEVLLYYKEADVFAFPSIETDEGDVDGVANVLLEAGVFKVPVVSTDAGSTGELIVDGVSGLVVAQRNPEILAEKIEILLNDKDLGIKLGEGLYEKVSNGFSLDKNIVQLENMLKGNY